MSLPNNASMQRPVRGRSTLARVLALALAAGCLTGPVAGADKKPTPAQKEVERLYARWQELEARRGS